MKRKHPHPPRPTQASRKIPRPGAPARGTKTGRPILILFDLLSRRKALRIIWELRAQRALNFRDLASASDTNPGVLNTRLRELRETKLVDHEALRGYSLTKRGQELVDHLWPAYKWAELWAKDLVKK